MKRALRTAAVRRIRLLATLLAACGALLLTAVPASASPDPTRDGWICDPGWYRINTSNNMVFDISQGPDAKGSVLQYQYVGVANQKWRVCHWPGDTSTTDYIFKSQKNGACLTLWDVQDGNWVTEGDCNGYIYGNQKFWLNRIPGTDKFTMQVQSSGAWLSVEAGRYDISRSHIVQYADRAGAFSLTAA
ncbi:RICIN domain-containing protein [Streptomyces melanogenes]|uniref:RICIN domain-containing protein n=1 Tax=Streptomyces melanogenes TaxID=67326 RepID=UPI00167C7ED0|nr:RICIN domain-containing protein [Streptomyces melanogenes]GGP54544.1 hypothetical protein GCM10010278_34180 [Streptomyces melanogenes]